MKLELNSLHSARVDKGAYAQLWFRINLRVIIVLRITIIMIIMVKKLAF